MLVSSGSKYFDTQWWKAALYSRWKDAATSFGFHPYEAKLTVNNIPFIFAVTTPLAKNWYAQTENDHSHELDALTAFGLQGAIVFECGGHHGRDCTVLAKIVGSEGRIVSFEPHPENIRVLRRNVELNHLQNVIAVNAAVGSKPGSLSIKSRSNAKVSHHGGIEVPVVTLDEWAETNGIWPDLIKIDVEGYEFEVLRGARRVLEKTPTLSVEVHCNIVGEFGATPEEIWKLIDVSKYDVWIQRHDGVAAEPLTGTTRLKGRPHLLFVPRHKRN
ncbi:FkbM family methyltransferase [Rhizobium sp. BK275]|uniref:FkbM family methyltransferase n=1 Tax=Rhizobium sp. BK275 TaxID=2587077 RepID=UPI0016221A78|nr:FkbM family methyltransferase [Rhizobium sp. BK275]MBB3393185.1 FkbM family methyltransferase [Rhizobium sp. BK275]